MEHDGKTDRVDAGGTWPARGGVTGLRFLEDHLRRFGEKRALVFALCNLLAVVLIGVLDALSGHEFGFSPFYLIPITIAAFYGGKRIGVTAALFATAAWYLAEVHASHPYRNPLAIYWNTGVRLLIFGIISLVLTRLKVSLTVEKAMREKLTELNNLKNQFVGMAAHDLRTPLAVIWMCAETLQRRLADATDRRQAESIALILEKSDFMLRMVAELLDLSALESGSLCLKTNCAEYGVFLRRHLKILQTLAERKHITIEFECDALPAVSFDQGRIEQVLDNLVMNAVKFSPPHSVVTVSVSREGERVVTRVTDRGIGISAEELPRVFMAFTKTSSHPVGGDKGAGLGLAIAKRIVEAHGGEIAVTSVPGAGATFLFTLPVHDLQQDSC